MSAAIRFVVSILVLTSLPVLLAEDWSRFRGQNGSGVSRASGIEIELGRNPLWKQPIPSGKSPPILTDSHVFVTGVGPDGLAAVS